MARSRRVTPLNSLTEVKQANAYIGNNYFSPDTMRFFGGRVSSIVYPTKFGTFVVTSERDGTPYTARENRAWGGMRRYSVRFVACRTVRTESYGHVYETGRGEVLNTSSDGFGRFASSSGAHAFAQREQKRLSKLLIKDKPVLFVERKSTEDDQS